MGSDESIAHRLFIRHNAQQRNPAMIRPALVASFVFSVLACASGWCLAAEAPDLVLHNGNVITVDGKFSLQQAIAVRGDRIAAVGKNDEVLKLKGDGTKVIDLKGQTLIPGLIDSHVHPSGAAMKEFDHEVPEMTSIADVLDYIGERAKKLGPGKWINVSQVFITRLKERRYPTRQELDKVAPENPVVFATGPDASINTLALKLSGIDKNFVVSGKGYIEKDERGEPTGILRSCTRYIKSGESGGKSASESDRRERLVDLFHAYNEVGLTSVIDRDCDSSSLDRYRGLLEAGRLTVRMATSQHVDTDGKLENIEQNIRSIAANPLTKGDSRLRIIGIKTYLDGGMLTGSAYMRQPWGVSEIYSIRDPEYKGVLFIPRERLLPIVKATIDSGLQFTAHSVGDGAVHQLLDVYEEINREKPIRDTRPSITHSNFMSKEAVEQAAKLGVVLDIQPAWLYLDGQTLQLQFGYDRLRYFQPLKSIFEAGGIAGGGSDHMQKIGARRSINFYDPFLAMATTVRRLPRGMNKPLHPEEALNREQMIKYYTINNAWIMRQEKDLGSLEVGKLADFVVLDTDLLTCPDEAIEKTKVVSTWLGGKMVYSR
jgi:predicted amidohydrolase YtcJ